MEERKLPELLRDYIRDQRMHFEGDTGVEKLSQIAESLGYAKHGFRYGSPLEVFLADNSGACQALIDWIGEQDIDEWKENLVSELPEEDEEKEEDPERWEE